MSEGEKDLSTLTVRLPEPLLRRFKVQCAKEGRPMSDVVREFIEWWTGKREDLT